MLFRSLFLLLTVVDGLLPKTFAATALVTFGGTERIVPKKGRMVVRTISLESGVVSDSEYNPNRRPKVKLNCTDRFCLAVVTASGIVKVKKTPVLREYFATSRAFGFKKPYNTANRRVARIKPLPLASQPALAVRHDGLEPKANEPSLARISLGASLNASPSQLRVGIPAPNFTVGGKLADSISSRDISSILTTTMGNHPCYNQSDSFAIFETDPRLLAERQLELDLVKNGWVDPSTAVEDRYQPPNANVRGNVIEQSGNVTVNLELVDTSGTVLNTTSASGSFEDWLNVVDKAALALADAICQGTHVSIESATCQLKACSCGANHPGLQLVMSMTGSAVLPVGESIALTLEKSDLSSQDCGGTTPSTYQKSLVACQRVSADQPETFSWSATTTTRSCTCPGDGAPSSLELAAMGFSPESLIPDAYAIRENVPCQRGP